MRVLVLNWLDRENPRAGGAEVHLHETFGRLAARGWEIALVTSGWEGAEPVSELDGIEVHRTGTRLSYPFNVARYVRTMLADRDFAVTVEDLNKAPLFAPSWAPGASLLLVHHLFGSTAFGQAPLPIAGVTWLLERAIPRGYRGVPVVAVSESTREDLVRRGLDRDLIRVVRNGVDTTTLMPASEQDRFGAPTVLYLGRLEPYKRIDLILHAIRRLVDDGQAVRVIVAGSGSDERRLRRLAARVGLDRDVVSFQGYVSEEAKRSLFQRAWVHVLTSEKEGWGITNLEAGACGTPTVASDSPGLRESVVDGETGFLVPHGDVPALADRIRRLVKDPELRARQGLAARRFAERHGWDATADGMAQALTGAVDSAPRAC